MPARPHIAFPPRLSRTGRFVVNEQGDDSEVASCIAVIVLWPRGTRRGMPDFGVVPPLFEPENLDELREGVEASEPRAVSLDPELLNAAMQRGVEQIRFGFDTEGS